MNSDLKEIRQKIISDWRGISPWMKPMFIGLLLALLHGALLASPYGVLVNSFTLKGLFSLRGERAVPPDVTVVSIDNTTYSSLKLPRAGILPRKLFAEAIEHITNEGARFVFVDILFFAEGQDQEGDRALSEALRKAPAALVRSLSMAGETDTLGRKAVRTVVRKPLEIFEKSVDYVIPAQVQFVDSDYQVVERISMPIEIEGTFGASTPLVKPLRRYVSEDIETPGRYDLINYYGETPSLTTVSFSRLFSEKKPDSAYFRNKLVFLGLGSHIVPGAAGEDSFFTPASNKKMYGVEIQATIAANLLDGSWIRRWSPLAEAAVLGALACLMGAALAWIRPKLAMIAAVLSALLWSIASYLFFTGAYFFLPGATLFLLVLPLFALLRLALTKNTQENDALLKLQ